MNKSILKKLFALVIAVSALTLFLPTSVLAAIPAAPSGVYGVATSGQVDIFWIDNSTDETGFNIERAPDIGGLGAGVFAPIGAAPAGAGPSNPPTELMFTDTTSLPLTAYWYRVQAYNGSGNSFYSNEVRILTSASAPRVTSLLQPTNGGFMSNMVNQISASASVSGTSLTSVEYQLVANNSIGTFDAKDIYNAPLDLTILAPRAAFPLSNVTVMPAGLPGGSIAEFEIRGTVSAVNAGTGVWTIGSVVSGHPEYTQPITVYESVTGQPQSTKFVGSRHPVAGDAVKIVAYRGKASGPLVAKTITYIAPAQLPGAPSLTLSFLLNGIVQSIQAPVTAPGYLMSGETWTIGNAKFRTDSQYFPTYIDPSVGINTLVTVRFTSPPVQANVARQIFKQITTATQTTTNINTVFDTTPLPLNVPNGTWLFEIIDGVVNNVDLVTGTWTIGTENIMCYQTAASLVAPATVGDEVLCYCRRSLTPGPLVIDQLYMILAGPLIQPYKPTAIDMRLMYNGVIASMNTNTWTIAGPAGTPVTFIVDDSEGKARIDPMPQAAFSVGNPVTVEFERVGEVLPDPANWASLTFNPASNTWNTTLAIPALSAGQTGTLFLRTTDATQHGFTQSYSSVVSTMPGSYPGTMAGIFSSGAWYIDTSRSGTFEAQTEPQVGPFGNQAGDVPLTVDWNGDNISELAFFRPGGTWYIDTNHSGTLDPGIDWTNSPNTFGRTAGDVPLAIDWNGDRIQELAIFRPGGTWFIDLNHNGNFDAGTDYTNSPGTFGRTAGDIPLAIDWDGNGTQELAIFRPGGTWFIDTNRNGAFDPGVDYTNTPNTFGRSAGDIPLAIDWNRDGTQEMIIFRPGGTWFIDTNRNGAFDLGVDLTNSPGTFGSSAGDIPIGFKGW
jgi:hypothetical protein